MEISCCKIRETRKTSYQLLLDVTMKKAPVPCLGSGMRCPGRKKHSDSVTNTRLYGRVAVAHLRQRRLKNICRLFRIHRNQSASELLRGSGWLDFAQKAPPGENRNEVLVQAFHGVIRNPLSWTVDNY
ncbi:hypothetical protein XPA_004344 [Xanthoria parietina]